MQNDCVSTETNAEISGLILFQVHSLPHVGGIMNLGLALLYSNQHMLMSNILKHNASIGGHFY